jgi:hypothetical protein
MVQLNKKSGLSNPRSFETLDDIGRKRSRGFAMIGLLALAPFLLAVFFVAAKMSRFAFEHTRIQSLCEQNLFQMQDGQAQRLNDLLELNPEALELRLDYERTKFDLGIAEAEQNHVLAGRLTARLIKIRKDRKALDKKQKSYLAEAESLRATQELRLSTALRKNSPRTKAPRLQVRADKPDDLAPIYKVLPDFPKIQTARSDYHWQDYRFHCAVTIEPRFGVYRARLTEVL